MEITNLKKSSRLAIKVALIYVIVGGGWILFSDELLSLFVSSPEARTKLSILKGWGFVLLTGSLLYLMLRRLLRRWEREIEQRKQAEAAQQDFEERYRRLFAVQNDAVILMDYQTNQILEVNPAAEKMYGFSHAEFLRLAATEVAHEKEKSGNASATEVKQVPLRMHRRKDGTVFPVEISYSDFIYQGRKIHVAAMRDITERKQAEADLLKSKQLYHDLFEHMNEGFAYCQMIFEGGQPADFVYLAVNQKFSTLTGLNEVTGKRVSEVIPGLREKDAELFEIYGRVAATGKPERFERFVVALNHWFDISVYNVERDYFVVVFDVITERKRAEQRMNLQLNALTAAANGIVITDRHGLIEWVNPAFTQLTGYTAEEAIGKNPRMLKSGQHPPEFYADMWRTILAGNVWRGEVINKRKDGQLYTEELTITSAREADGQIGHFVAIKQDITERRKLEVQLRHGQKMDAIGQLASGVAHDFNNILTVIQLQAGMLKAGQNLTDQQRNFTGEIEKAAKHAADLTGQLLLFSRKQALQLRDLDLNDVVTNLAKMLQRIIAEDVGMKFKHSPQPLLIHADAGMMDQILMNLTVNARDAMPNGGQFIIETSAVEFDEVTAAQMDQGRPGAFACVSVTDTGCGIAPEILPLIFEPFFTTKEAGKGTGLGLATVFGIVQQHHGWISVYSEAGLGTTFRVYLPRLLKTPDPKAGWVSLATIGGGRETILLVEDDASLRAAVRTILSRLGYHVLEARTGVVALEVWQQHRSEIQLLLTDMVMPDGINGKELAQRLLKENPKLKVIYASGYTADIASKDLRLEEGVNFLTKPFEAHKLAQTVRNCLDAN